MALRLRPGHRGAPEVGVVVPDPDPSRRPRTAGDLVGAGHGKPAAPPSVPAHGCRPGVRGGVARPSGREDQPTAAPSLEGGLMPLLFVPMLALVGVAIALARRSAQAPQDFPPADLAVRLLRWAAGLLSPERDEW